MQGYAAFLASGGMYGDDSIADVSAVIGAEAAAIDSTAGDMAWRSITIGVTTGVLTFLLNRWLGKVLG